MTQNFGENPNQKPSLFRLPTISSYKPNAPTILFRTCYSWLQVARTNMTHYLESIETFGPLRIFQPKTGFCSVNYYMVRYICVGPLICGGNTSSDFVLRGNKKYIFCCLHGILGHDCSVFPGQNWLFLHWVPAPSSIFISFRFTGNLVGPYSVE